MPTTTTGNPATRSPVIAIRSSSIGAFESSRRTVGSPTSSATNVIRFCQGQAMSTVAPVPGALYDYFAGKSDKAALGDELTSENPAEHPEWFNRDAAVDMHGRTGCAKPPGCFPRTACAWKAPCSPTSKRRSRSSGRSTGGSKKTGASHTRTESSACRSSPCPMSTWRCPNSTGASSAAPASSVSAMAPRSQRSGTRSPADPMFDPFWARVEEAGVVVAPHAGFEDGYRAVEDVLASTWGYSTTRKVRRHVGVEPV